jgi:hypothetical protein
VASKVIGASRALGQRGIKKELGYTISGRSRRTGKSSDVSPNITKLAI